MIFFYQNGLQFFLINWNDWILFLINWIDLFRENNNDFVDSNLSKEYRMKTFKLKSTSMRQKHLMEPQVFKNLLIQKKNEIWKCVSFSWVGQ